jgi:hypothetical protein
MSDETDCDVQNLHRLDNILSCILSISYIRESEQPFSFDEIYMGRCGRSFYLINHKKRKIMYIIFRNGSLDLLQRKLSVLSYTGLYDIQTLEFEDQDITDFETIQNILRSEQIVFDDIPDLDVWNTYQQYLNMSHDECLEYLRTGKQKVFKSTKISSWDNIIISAEIVDIKFGIKVCERHHKIPFFSCFRRHKIFESCSICSLLNRRNLPILSYIQNQILHIPESFTFQEWKQVWNYFDSVIQETPYCVDVLACILQSSSLPNE